VEVEQGVRFQQLPLDVESNGTMSVITRLTISRMELREK